MRGRGGRILHRSPLEGERTDGTTAHGPRESHDGNSPRSAAVRPPIKGSNPAGLSKPGGGRFAGRRTLEAVPSRHLPGRAPKAQSAGWHRDAVPGPGWQRERKHSGAGVGVAFGRASVGPGGELAHPSGTAPFAPPRQSVIDSRDRLGMADRWFWFSWMRHGHGNLPPPSSAGLSVHQSRRSSLCSAFPVESGGRGVRRLPQCADHLPQLPSTHGGTTA